MFYLESKQIMDIGTVSSLSNALSQAGTGDAIGTLVLKKAMQMQEQSAIQLLEAIPTPPGNPSHLGNQIDIKV